MIEIAFLLSMLYYFFLKYDLVASATPEAISKLMPPSMGIGSSSSGGASNWQNAENEVSNKASNNRFFFIFLVCFG